MREIPIIKGRVAGYYRAGAGGKRIWVPEYETSRQVQQKPAPASQPAAPTPENPPEVASFRPPGQQGPKPPGAQSPSQPPGPQFRNESNRQLRASVFSVADRARKGKLSSADREWLVSFHAHRIRGKEGTQEPEDDHGKRRFQLRNRALGLAQKARSGSLSEKEKDWIVGFYARHVRPTAKSVAWVWPVRGAANAL